MTAEVYGSICLPQPYLGNTPIKKEGVSMDSKLMWEIRLEQQLNTLLK